MHQRLYRYLPTGGSSRSRFGLKPNDVVLIVSDLEEGQTYFLTPKGAVAFVSFPLWIDMEFWRVDD